MSSAILSYSLSLPDANTLVLTTTKNFAVAGLGTTQTGVAGVFNNAMFASVPAPALLPPASPSSIQSAAALIGNAPVIAPVVTPPPALAQISNALLSLPTAAAVAAAYDQLTPEVYNGGKTSALLASLAFTNELMSCRVQDGEGATFIAEGQCAWMRTRGQLLERDGSATNGAFKETTWSTSAGAQLSLGGDWRLGFAGGYEHANLSNTSGAYASTERANLGAIVKYNPGLLLIAAGVTGSYDWTDTERYIAFGGFAGKATSSSTLSAANARLNASYLFNNGSWYVKPLVDVNATFLDLNGFTEQGGNGAALIVKGRSDTVLSVSPAVELGGDAVMFGLSVRPFIRAGVTVFDTKEFKLDAAFASTPTLPFQITSSIDGLVTDVSAGLDVFGEAGSVLRFQYDGQFGETTRRNSGTIKGSVPF